MASTYGMRILVEPSDYVIRNSGDTAMLQVALERLSDLWPAARIQVFSDQPEAFPFRHPNVEALSTLGRRLWFSHHWRYAFCGVPVLRLRASRGVRGWLQRNHPQAVLWLLRATRRSSEKIAAVETFLEAVLETDLLVVTGMGGVTDAFPDYASELLEVLLLAQRSGARTVMLGQGMGPIADPRLRRLAGTVLPRVDLLALREGRAGLPLLRSLGVADGRMLVTGDDAIELATRWGARLVGDGIGINLRAASYAGVDLRIVDRVRPAVQAAARAVGAALIPIPISRVPGEEDAATIRAILAGLDDASDGGIAIDSPEKVVRELTRCRILVAGSYHAGVFALACGIPTVAIVRSRYYVDKFLGLADMFGGGCKVVHADDPELEVALPQALRWAWASADDLRPILLDRARRQLEASRSAYRKLADLPARS